MELPLGPARTKFDADKIPNIYEQVTSTNPDEIEAGLRAVDQLDKEELTQLFSDYDIKDFAPPEIMERAPIDLQIKYKGEATKTKKLKNGSQITWMIKDYSDAVDALTGYQSYRIDWDIPAVDVEAGEGLGREATTLFRQFDEIAQELKPGAIIQTEAAADGFGAGRSEAQWRKHDAAAEGGGAKKWITENEDALRTQYLRDIGQTDPAYWDDLPMQAKWDHFEGQPQPNVPGFEADGGIRQKIYERAGLSKPVGKSPNMYGIVMGGKQGRRRMVPLDINGDIEKQVADAINMGVEQYDEVSLPALGVVADRVKAGVPVYWDDVAETVPEMFTPGTRVIENPEFPPEVLARLRDPGPGVSINPFTGEEPATGFMVAIDGKTLKSFEEVDIQDFIAQNYDILTREDAYLGAWVSDITGKPVVEISRRVESFEEAKGLGKAFDQEGIFDTSMQTGIDGYHPTGGIDRLKETQGYHLKSAYTTKNYVRTLADAQSIARNQFTPGAPNGALGGRIMTDEQLHVLGDPSSLTPPVSLTR